MSRRNNWIFTSIFCLVASGLAAAQGPAGAGAPGGPGGPGGFGRPPMERMFHDRGPGRWWNDPRLAQALNLTDDQKKKMDDIFQQHRLNLIDLDANLQKQEVILGPMIGADQPNEDQVLAQIDKVAQARADLEKANARMLFDIRKTLTPDQWQKLKTLHAEHRDNRMHRGEPGAWRQRQQEHPGGPDPGMAAPPAAGAPPQGQPPAPQGDAQDAPPPGDGAPAMPAAPQS